MGQIRKRGDYYQIRYYRNGQRIEESTGFTKWEDARDELRKREGQVSDGVPLTARSVRLTFDDAVKDVEADYVTGWRVQSEILPLEWRQRRQKGRRGASGAWHNEESGREGIFLSPTRYARLSRHSGSSRRP
jgi:hypothetical protein